MGRRGRTTSRRRTSGARDFFVDWDHATVKTAALLRAEAGREPHDRALRELVGELSTLSPEFRTQWAAHHVRIRHDGAKQLRHPELVHHSQGTTRASWRSVRIAIRTWQEALGEGRW
ncbi:hypothetical protein ACFYWX_26245 [Streptomyces sp. NPDC002888]|uniref:MmyB family transcriptional regulator n=1 Tax=Streptomyces sp. NPDC002888 TaxID=3364668 RepID=UPI0036B1A59F